MTSFQTLLCKIPQNLDQKQIFVEIKFTSEFLTQFKKYIFHVFDIFAAIEKSYRQAANTFTSAIQKTTTISNGLPDSNIVLSFVNSHERRVEQLNKRAYKFANIQNNQFLKLKNNFHARKKQLSSDLQKLKSFVQPSLDDLYKSLNGYDKYFNLLQKSVTNPNPAQQIKAITQLDEKLSRTQYNYNNFHQKFGEYCKRRDQIFGDIDKLVAETIAELNDIIRQAMEIDKGLIEEIDFNQSNVEVNLSNFWTETLDEEVMKNTNSNSDFYVTPEKEIKTDKGIISPGEVLKVIEANGDYWLVQSKANEKFEVPSKHLKPKLF